MDYTPGSDFLILFQELIGTAAGKLHTGRSRNDQVATDMRLWLKEAVTTLKGFLKALLNVMINRAKL